MLFHDDHLEVGIEIYGPKEFIDVYESYFHTISAALLIIKAFPELKDIVRIELRKNQENITNAIQKILEEKEKHIGIKYDKRQNYSRFEI